MSKDYSMYRYYKGEEQNPFSAILDAHEIDKSHLPPPESMKYEYNLSSDEVKNLGLSAMFWNYEKHFEEEFISNESSDWYAFLNIHGRGDRFMKLLSDEDYQRPREAIKAGIFELWLEYFFTEKLYPEYGGERNVYKEWYCS